MVIFHFYPYSWFHLDIMFCLKHPEKFLDLNSSLFAKCANLKLKVIKIMNMVP